MPALVVYESMYGNTQKVAEAVAEGLAGAMPVEVVEVGGAPAAPPQDTTLLVVGAPTHALGLSRPRSRADAAGKSPDGTVVSAGPGVREWLDGLPEGRGPAAAAFDTRLPASRYFGTAAGKIQKQLRRHGMAAVSTPHGFNVDGALGPLSDGELARARAWGEELARLVG